MLKLGHTEPPDGTLVNAGKSESKAEARAYRAAERSACYSGARIANRKMMLHTIVKHVKIQVPFQ